MSSPSVNLNNGKFDDSVDDFLRSQANLGKIPKRIDDYLSDREVDLSIAAPHASPVQLRQRMARFILSRGATLDSDAKAQSGAYDEILFSAYDDALRHGVGSSSDPLDLLHSANVDPATEGWDFQVDTFSSIEQQGVLPESIRAAGAIDYIYELGERLGVFALAEALVMDWSTGAVDVAQGAAAGKLYRYWKLIDQRSNADERGMLYRRVLDKGGAQVLSGGMANNAFPALWNQLMSELAHHIDKAERLEAGRTDLSPVSTKPIQQAIREIQYNLTEHCSGMAFAQARELYAQLQQALEIFRDPDIVAGFGGVRRRNMWVVIEQLSRRRLQRTLPINAIVRLAVDGNRIFQIIAEYDESTFGQTALHNLLEAGETYIISASVAAKALGEPTLEGVDAMEEDPEVADDTGSDF
jgi:hypothetical protein